MLLQNTHRAPRRNAQLPAAGFHSHPHQQRFFPRHLSALQQSTDPSLFKSCLLSLSLRPRPPLDHSVRYQGPLQEPSYMHSVIPASPPEPGHSPKLRGMPISVPPQRGRGAAGPTWPQRGGREIGEGTGPFGASSAPKGQGGWEGDRGGQEGGREIGEGMGPGGR